MKQIRLILVIVLGAAFSLSANATTVLTEQFQDYATGPLGSVGTGQTGGVPGWNTPKSHIVVTNGSDSLDGTALGLVASAGDRVFIAPTANTNDNYDADTSSRPNGAINGFANKNQPPPAFPGTNAANLYTSFLYQFDDNTNFYTNNVTSTIAGMHRVGSGIQSTADASYWRLFARSNSVNTVQLGIAKNPFATVTEPKGVTNWASTLVTVGQPFFVVVRLQIVATNSMTYYTNDEVDLWINPPANTFGTNEANIPTPDAVSPPDDGAVDGSTTGPGRFFITDNGPRAEMDELRISTNWADVTPPFGQCLTASVTASPTNITQVAGINARFTVKAANSTAPTYQWQISQNSGATWSDISGANHSSYTTPNLQLASDNGNQYRAIINCACDGSAATSAVATVTLSAPVTTAPGTIMNDTFPTPPPFRDVGPVTSTHSVWYTSATSPYAAADLVTDPGGTGLIATPITGSSSLFLGYYIAETLSSRVPVDLAIGTQITATLRFIPNTFNSFTNNGGLRFGLFDYADSGTLYGGDDPSLTGSLGNGLNVRGYMLDLDFGQAFSSSNPLSLYVRTGMGDNNLMGTTGDYNSMGSGPFNGAYSNVAAFQAGTTYTLTLTVARTATNNSTVTANITGGTLNLTYSAADTNALGYHRFDAIAVRPNRLENAADTFTFPLLNVQVASLPVPSVTNVSIASIKDVFIGATTNVTTNSVTLTWKATPAVNASSFFVQRKDNSLTDSWGTVASQLPSTVTNWTDLTTNKVSFYRVFGQ